MQSPRSVGGPKPGIEVSLEAAGRPVATLLDGPVDVIGDVHGEIDALLSLLGHLGYANTGSHPDGRRAVFVGDLCDRGPDSPAVLDLVMDRVRLGLAQCVLGNHELNVLLGAPKHGNGWFFDRNHELQSGEFLHSRAATPERRRAWVGFLDRLPLALERADLRIVHACWDDAAIARLGSCLDDRPYVEAHEEFRLAAKSLLTDTGIERRAARELGRYRHELRIRNATVPMLPAVAEEATMLQNGNPVKVLTSGLEAPASDPSWAGGQWRMTQRSRWWNEYTDARAVITGHYWRRDLRASPEDVTGDWDYPLGDYGPYEWMGPRRNVFCVDYSVGGRYVERQQGREPPFQTRLAALRWPERELVFDDGERRETVGFQN
jgi:hypothetical protein